MAEPGATACDIRLGTRGWDHPHWVRHWYPEDLPEDWRLGYYANAFRAVLVPSGLLRASDAGDFESWLDDVHDDFLFYLEIETGEEPLAEIREILAGQVGGLVLRDPRLDVGRLHALLIGLPGPDELPRWYWAKAGSADGPAGFQPIWNGPGQAATGLAVLAMPEAGLRAARSPLQALIDSSPGQCYGFLCMDPAPDGDLMEQLRVMLELLGG